MVKTHQSISEQRRYDAEVDYLNRLHGEPPMNPFREYRLNANLSLAGLQIQSGLSKNALVRAEQGTYANPIPSLSQFWQRRLNISDYEIQLAYEDFQEDMRKRHKLYFGPTLNYNAEAPIHPFRQIRNNRLSKLDNLPLPVGPDEVSRALCLPVDTLRYFEKKFRLQKSVPRSILNTLIYIGYKHHEVHEFSQSYERWRSTRVKLSDVEVATT